MDKLKLKTLFDEYGSVSAVAAKLNLHQSTVKKMVLQYDITFKRVAIKNVNLGEILEGQHPQYPTYLLKQRLLKNKILVYECNRCHINEYNNEPIALDLEHKNGDRSDHRFHNLCLLCPNCHSQTDTYKSKNKKCVEVDCNGVIELFHEEGSIVGVLRRKNYCCNTSSKEYKAVKKLLVEAGLLTSSTHNTKNYSDYSQVSRDEVVETFKNCEHSVTKTLQVLQLSSKHKGPAWNYIVECCSDIMNHKVRKEKRKKKDFVPEFTKERLQQHLNEMPITHIAELYGKSDNGIKRWVKKWKLEQPPRGWFLRTENKT